MSTDDEKSKQARSICEQAEQQKTRFSKYQVTVTELEKELTEEEVVIKDMIANRKGGQAGDLLTDGLEKRKITVNEMNKELDILVKKQTEITNQAAEHAGKILGDHAAEMDQQKKKADIATKFQVAKQGAAMQGKHDAALIKQSADDDEKHRTEKAKNAAAHTAEKAKMTKEHGAKQAGLVVDLSNKHAAHTANMVSVNAEFLQHVKTFVGKVKGLLSKRAQYEGVFLEIDHAIVTIDQELGEFSSHATQPVTTGPLASRTGLPVPAGPVQGPPNKGVI